MNLTQQLTHQLGESIVNGAYPVGQTLPSEAQLSELFKVSRSATREAVKTLAAKGLIASRPKHGIRVLPERNWNLFDGNVLRWILSSKPSLQLLKEFTQVRLGIEPIAANLAAKNANQQQLIQLQDALTRISHADEGLDDQLDAHIHFLNSILAASGNRFFMQLTQFVDAALRVSIRYSNHYKGVENTDNRFHQHLFAMIECGDAQGAQTLVSQQIEDALSLIEARL